MGTDGFGACEAAIVLRAGCEQTRDLLVDLRVIDLEQSLDRLVIHAVAGRQDIDGIDPLHPGVLLVERNCVGLLACDLYDEGRGLDGARSTLGARAPIVVEGSQMLEGVARQVDAQLLAALADRSDDAGLARIHLATGNPPVSLRQLLPQKESDAVFADHEQVDAANPEHLERGGVVLVGQVRRLRREHRGSLDELRNRSIVDDDSLGVVDLTHNGSPHMSKLIARLARAERDTDHSIS